MSESLALAWQTNFGGGRHSQEINSIHARCSHLWHVASLHFISSEGKGEGDAVKGGPGKLYKYSVAYVAQKRPRLVMYENVARLARVARYKKVLKKITSKLKHLGYSTTARIINTANWGVPQTRNRIYMVAIWKDAQRCKFQWPRDIPLKYTMADVMEPLNNKTDKPWCIPGKTSASSKMTVKQRLRSCALVKKAMAAEKKWRRAKKAGDCSMPAFVGIDCSMRYCRWSSQVMHTLTATRGRAGGPWCCARSRRMTLNELGWAQGLAPTDIPFDNLGISHSQAGGMLGNGMSLNVVERTLANV